MTRKEAHHGLQALAAQSFLSVLDVPRSLRGARNGLSQMRPSQAARPGGRLATSTDAARRRRDPDPVSSRNHAETTLARDRAGARRPDIPIGWTAG